MERHTGENPNTTKLPIDERIQTGYSDRANELRNSMKDSAPAK